MPDLDAQVIRKLFLVDQREQDQPDAKKWTSFWSSLTAAEQQAPMAQWLRRKQDDLDWLENIGDFLTTYYGIRRRPWYPNEYPPEYVAAYQQEVAALYTRLEAEPE